MGSTKVVILGGGFAGINAAKALGNANFDVWIIDKTNHHLFQPLLYQVASAALSPGDIAIPIREILSPYKNVTVIMGEVIQIDKEDHQVVLRNGDRIGYEYLIVALGARHSYFGNDQWEAFAPGLKTLVDALKIRERILVSFEKAERCDSISEAKKYLNFVIIGGGPTGVEMAGAISEIAYHTMLKDFRRIDTTKTKIYLVEGSPHILHESGAGNYNMGQKGRFCSFLRSESGLRFHEITTFDWGRLIFREKASYAYQKAFSTGRITAFLVGSPGTFTVDTLTGAQNLGVFEFSMLFDAAHANVPYVDLRFQGEFGSHYQSYQGMLELGKAF
jgi:hypothetical protein